MFPLDVRLALKRQRMAQQVAVYVLVRLRVIKGGYVIGRGRPRRRLTRLLAGLVSRCVPRSVLVPRLDRVMRRHDNRPTPQVISAAGPYGAERETVETRWLDDAHRVPLTGEQQRDDPILSVTPTVSETKNSLAIASACRRSE